MHTLTLYRKRLIPNECIQLKGDEIVYRNDDIIITKWTTINPKPEFHHGSSCYFLNEGIKMSKFYRSDGSLVCWYCDIVEYNFSEDGSNLVSTDLLADVVISPNGEVKVVDLDELADALDQGLLSTETMKTALLQLNNLLTKIYDGHFSSMQEKLNSRGL